MSGDPAPLSGCGAVIKERSGAYDKLAEIAPVEHPDERFGCLVQALYDVLAITNAAVGDAGSDIAREFGVVLLGKFGVDESAQRQALRQDLAHRRRQSVRAVAGARTVVLGDQAADRYARVFVEQWQYRLPDGTADILEVNVDAVWTSSPQLGWKIGRAVIDRGVEAQFGLKKAHFAGPPAMPTARAPASFASWPTSDPTGPLAAATTTVSPGCGLPITCKPPYAV